MHVKDRHIISVLFLLQTVTKQMFILYIYFKYKLILLISVVKQLKYKPSDSFDHLTECIVPQIFNLRPHLLKSIVRVIRSQTGSTLSIVYIRTDCHLTIYP